MPPIIPYGHRHYFQVISSEESEFGLTMRSRCNDRYLQEDDGSVRLMLPGCGMEEERMFDNNRLIVSVRYRFGGLWFSPIDLYRATPLPVEVCSKCHGEPQPVRCSGCHGSGVADVLTALPVVAPNIPPAV